MAMSPGRRTRPGRARARRGLTILEVVLAATLAAMIALAVSSTISYVYKSQARERQKLACAELCHRLLLQYLDDPDLMPNATFPIRYGPDLYRFRWRDDPIVVRPAVPRPRGQASMPSAGIDRFRYVTVEVWLGEESGGAYRPAPGVPRHQLTRVADPIPLRSPDSMERMADDEEGISELVGIITGGAARGSRTSDSGPEAPDGAGNQR